MEERNWQKGDSGSGRPRFPGGIFPGERIYFTGVIKRMSRAFTNEDAGSGGPPKEFGLPPRDDPAYDAVAAEVLLEAARNGDTSSAEEATGYYWGEPRLRDQVRRILARAEAAGDERLVQLARRFLR
jgi:hypothetical protein